MAATIGSPFRGVTMFFLTDMSSRASVRASSVWGTSTTCQLYSVHHSSQSMMKLTQVHLVSIEVGVVRITNTLVQSESTPGSDFGSMTHDR